MILQAINSKILPSPIGEVDSGFGELSCHKNHMKVIKAIFIRILFIISVLEIFYETDLVYIKKPMELPCFSHMDAKIEIKFLRFLLLREMSHLKRSEKKPVKIKRLSEQNGYYFILKMSNELPLDHSSLFFSFSFPFSSIPLPHPFSSFFFLPPSFIRAAYVLGTFRDYRSSLGLKTENPC